MGMQMSRQKSYSLNKNKYLLDPERQKLEELLQQFMASNLRDCLLLSIALKTGARAQEILNLKLSDINEHDKSIFFHGIKGSNDRELPIAPKLFQSLMLYIHNGNFGDSQNHVFPISYNRLRQIWQFYRPTHKKFHSLRHTFAIQLYKKTKDIRLVQFALGHRNITNTMIYADYVYSQQELKKLIL